MKKRMLFLLTLVFVPVVVMLSILKSADSTQKYSSETNSLRGVYTGGPFESSGSTSRYVLTEAIVKDKTVFLNEQRARFASPDVSKHSERYFSLFAPGVSFLGVPLYLLGTYFDQAQIFTYSLSMLFAIINTLLIVIISRKLNANLYASILAGLIFLFASNALSYALTFTQHHASVFFILTSILLVLAKRTAAKNLLLGVTIGAAILIDIPNLLLMLPVVGYAFLSLIRTKKSDDGKQVRIIFNPSLVMIIIGALPFAFLFGWYNHHLTGSYTLAPQFVGMTKDFRDTTLEEKLEPETQTRHFRVLEAHRLPNSMSVLISSHDRGIIYFSPIVLLALFGAKPFLKSKRKAAYLLAFLIATTFLVYGMWADPWGGWAFGPRYLIPAIAFACVFLSFAISSYGKKIWFIALFIPLLAYSITVNLAGALTTTQLPPSVEAEYSAYPKYIFLHSFDLISEGFTGSLAYNMLLKGVVPLHIYAATLFMVVFGTIGFVYILQILDKSERSNK